MNIDKPCYNSFCEPAATERRSKKTHGLSPMHTESLTRIFFDLCFFSMHRDFRRICKRDRLRLVLDHESPESHEYIPGRNLKDSSDSSD